MKSDALALAPPAPALQLSVQLKDCRTWAEVEQAIATCPDLKSEAWHLLDAEEKAWIKELKRRATATPPQPDQIAPVTTELFKVSARVTWLDCPASLEMFNPFTIREVEGDKVWLDWVCHPIHFSKLSV